MTAFLKKIGLFILFSGGFYLVMAIVWGNLVHPFFRPNLNLIERAYGHLNSRIQDIENYDQVDVLFLGSSHAYRGFDTRIFAENGINSFNLGSNSQSPVQTLVLLKRYLDDLNPKMVVFEVYPSSFVNDGVESSLDLLSNDKNDANSWWMVQQIGHIKTFNTYLLSLWRDFTSNTDYVEDPRKEEYGDTYIPGGYVERDMPAFYETKEYDELQWEIRDEQLEHFEEIVEMIKDRDIELVLVFAPITPQLYHAYTNNDEFDQMMVDYGEYINFNELVELDDSLHFYDAHHMNQSGVEIFNQKLIEKLFNQEEN